MLTYNYYIVLQGKKCIRISFQKGTFLILPLMSMRPSIECARQGHMCCSYQEYQCQRRGGWYVLIINFYVESGQKIQPALLRPGSGLKRSLMGRIWIRWTGLSSTCPTTWRRPCSRRTQSGSDSIRYWGHSRPLARSVLECSHHTSYLSFFLHMAHFWLQFFSTQKARKSRQNRFHGKTA